MLRGAFFSALPMEMGPRRLLTRDLVKSLTKVSAQEPPDYLGNAEEQGAAVPGLSGRPSLTGSLLHDLTKQSD